MSSKYKQAVQTKTPVNIYKILFFIYENLYKVFAKALHKWEVRGNLSLYLLPVSCFSDLTDTFYAQLMFSGEWVNDINMGVLNPFALVPAALPYFSLNCSLQTFYVVCFLSVLFLFMLFLISGHFLSLFGLHLLQLNFSILYPYIKSQIQTKRKNK